MQFDTKIAVVLSDEVAETSGFSGAIRVDRGDEVVLATAYGFAHRAYEIRNTVDTQFAIASGTKGLTAVAVVSLVEEGSLDLSTTARSVLGQDLPLIATTSRSNICWRTDRVSAITSTRKPISTWRTI